MPHLPPVTPQLGTGMAAHAAGRRTSTGMFDTSDQDVAAFNQLKVALPDVPFMRVSAPPERQPATALQDQSLRAA
jgi:hypothetical protein